MPRKYNRTLEDHLKWAPMIREMDSMVMDSYVELGKHHQKQGKVNALLYKMTVLMRSLKSELDDEYHKLIDDEQFYRLGHIYYGGRHQQTAPRPPQTNPRTSNTASPPAAV